jgi:uncharacterized SAM-binding protein YcdF (DUF218 family)
MKRRSTIRPSGSRFILAIGFVAALFVFGSAYAFYHAGTWLVREDPLENSQAILVLSGGLPDRALAAAKIYRDGYAKEVWLTQPLQPAAAMEDLHLPYAGEEEYSRMVLIEKGVRPADIHILKPRILNTTDELRVLADALHHQPGVTVIVVTSKAHTRRVRTLWKRLPRSQNDSGRLVVRAASEDYFDAAHWWRTTPDALSVVREYLGLMNAWAGLPLTHEK